MPNFVTLFKASENVFFLGIGYRLKSLIGERQDSRVVTWSGKNKYMFAISCTIGGIGIGVKND